MSRRSCAFFFFLKKKKKKKKKKMARGAARGRRSHAFHRTAAVRRDRAQVGCRARRDSGPTRAAPPNSSPRPRSQTATRRAGGLAAAVLFAAVLPANVKMARDWQDKPAPMRALAYARLPLQAPLIWVGHQGRARLPKTRHDRRDTSAADPARPGRRERACSPSRRIPPEREPRPPPCYRPSPHIHPLAGLPPRSPRPHRLPLSKLFYRARL